jgi:hypothetical protein
MDEKYLKQVIGGTVHTIPTLEQELARLSKAQLCHRWGEYKDAGHRCFVLKELWIIRTQRGLEHQQGVAQLVYGTMYGWTRNAEIGKRVA